MYIYIHIYNNSEYLWKAIISDSTNELVNLTWTNSWGTPTIISTSYMLWREIQKIMTWMRYTNNDFLCCSPECVWCSRMYKAKTSYEHHTCSSGEFNASNLTSHEVWQCGIRAQKAAQNSARWSLLLPHCFFSALWSALLPRCFFSARPVLCCQISRPEQGVLKKKRRTACADIRSLRTCWSALPDIMGCRYHSMQY